MGALEISVREEAMDIGLTYYHWLDPEPEVVEDAPTNFFIKIGDGPKSCALDFELRLVSAHKRSPN